MKISIIVAASENHCIGKDNQLLWHLPVDMAYFKKLTENHCVLMGKNTYYSIPSKFRPLPKRVNLVVTRKGLDKDELSQFENLHDYPTIMEAIHKAESLKEHELFIIGGGQIYQHSMELADTIYLTKVHTEIEGDAYFPIIDQDQWLLTASNFVEKDEKNKFDCTFETWKKINL